MTAKTLDRPRSPMPNAGLVSDWMGKPVVSIKPKDTLLRARLLIAHHEINQLPVLKNGKLVGLLTDRDIRDAYPSSLPPYEGRSIDAYAKSHFVEDAMTYNVITVKKNASVQEAAQLLWRNRIGSLPVVDGDNVVGIFTRSDLIKVFLHASGLGLEPAQDPEETAGMS